MRWIIDDDWDIGFQLFFVTFIKYKNGVVVEWFKRYPSAPKHVAPVPLTFYKESYNYD